MKKLNLLFACDEVTTHSDVFVRFNKSQGIEDQRKISNFTKIGRIPASSIRGWIRHGMESLLIGNDISVCHPLSDISVTAEKTKTMYQNDLQKGYHSRGDCTKKHTDGCIIYRLFGDLNNISKIIIPSIYYYPANTNSISKFSNIGTGRTEINRNSPRCRHDGVGVYLTTEHTVAVCVTAPITIVLTDLTDVGEVLLYKTLEYLYKKVENYDYRFYLGGNRTMGGGRAVILYSEDGKYHKRGIIGLSKKKFEVIDKRFEEIIKKEKELFPIEKE